MKKSKLNLVLCVFFFSALFTMVSCSKDNELSKGQASFEQPDFNFLETNTSLSTDVSLVNGILNFNSLDDFRSSLLALNRMNPQEQAQWQQTLGFNSMQQIFNDIMLAEFEKPGSEHSNLYKENMQTGLIVYDGTTGLYKLNIFSPAYAPVLNQQGLVMVDEVLYHFAAGALKTWEGADINNVEAILDATMSTGNINVFPIRMEETNLRATSSWSDACLSHSGDSEMILSGNFLSDFIIEGLRDIIFVDFYINVRTMIPNTTGEMEYDPGAVLDMKGKYKADLTVTNGSMEFVKPFENMYEQIIGSGGNFNFIPDVTGVYQTNAPWYFTQPAQLIQTWWFTYAKTSDGTMHECEIAY